MSALQALSTEDIEVALQTLPGWSVKTNKLHKEWKFLNFEEAFGFMTRVALVAERMNHHPDWFNTYNVLIIDLYTHTKNAITLLDIQMALNVEKIVGDDDQVL